MEKKSPEKLVFISYASEDRRHAALVASDLRALRIEPWFDRERLLPGMRWKSEIVNAIRRCDSFIALLSTSSVAKSGMVKKELQEALEIINLHPELADCYLIPVRLEECKVPKQLRERQYVDLFKDWTTGINRIVAAINRNRMLPNLVRDPGLTSIPQISSYDQIPRIELRTHFLILGKVLVQVTLFCAIAAAVIVVLKFIAR